MTKEKREGKLFVLNDKYICERDYFKRFYKQMKVGQRKGKRGLGVALGGESARCVSMRT